jgi:hypothetical protein
MKTLSAFSELDAEHYVMSDPNDIKEGMFLVRISNIPESLTQLSWRKSSDESIYYDSAVIC